MTRSATICFPTEVILAASLHQGHTRQSAALVLSRGVKKPGGGPAAPLEPFWKNSRLRGPGETTDDDDCIRVGTAYRLGVELFPERESFVPRDSR